MPLVDVTFIDKMGVLAKEFYVLIKKVAHEVAMYEGVEIPLEVNVTITDNEGIQALNKEFRGKDMPTDVLSFPLMDYETPSVINAEQADFENGKLILGDIVISLERAKAQAEEYGHGLEREMGFLVAHSMLHLLGYDHMNSEEEVVMVQKQEAVLQNIGLTR